MNIPNWFKLSSKPDFIIRDGSDEVYMNRWYVIPRNKWFNIYLHHFHKSDDDRALHDHPWANMSLVLKGTYIEVTEGTPQFSDIADKLYYYQDQLRLGMPLAGPLEARTERKPFRPVFRRATDAHRVELIEGRRVWSLFFTGRNVRTWGFHCPKGWIPWTEFVQMVEGGNKRGKGCE